MLYLVDDCGKFSLIEVKDLYDLWCSFGSHVSFSVMNGVRIDLGKPQITYAKPCDLPYIFQFRKYHFGPIIEETDPPNFLPGLSDSIGYGLEWKEFSEEELSFFRELWSEYCHRSVEEMDELGAWPFMIVDVCAGDLNDTEDDEEDYDV